MKNIFSLKINMHAIHFFSLVFFVFFIFHFSSLIFPPTAGADFPTSDNYQIQEYSFGAGGTKGSSSESFGLFGTAGQIEFGRPSSANFKIGSGLEYIMMAHIPNAPTFTNPSQNYDRLHFIINTSSNPSDTKYALQMSTTSNFSSNVSYIKPDNTPGPTLTVSDFQTYSDWGSATGEYITGLEPGTIYYLRVKATQGDFTESGFSPSASAQTSVPSLSFSVDNSGANEAAITFDNLNSGNAYTDDQKYTDLITSTNAVRGYVINAHSTGPLTSGGDTLADYAGTNASPTSWSGYGFGYTTNDTSLTDGLGGYDNRFASATNYAGFTSDIEGHTVADHESPVITAITNETFRIKYRVTANSNQKAGQYTTTIMYVVVPTY